MRASAPPFNVVPFAPRRPRPALERELRATRHFEDRKGLTLICVPPRRRDETGESDAAGDAVQRSGDAPRTPFGRDWIDSWIPWTPIQDSQTTDGSSIEPADDPEKPA